MEQYSPMKEIVELSDKLPIAVQEDVHQRLTDWFCSGGKEDDSYVHQQLDYVKRVLVMKGLNKLYEDE